MQVKKFEAPTIQEALETIKRELGPEAIILATRKNKKGFGLLSKGAVEVTAAVSERALQKKKLAEERLPEPVRETARRQPAAAQADMLDKTLERHLARAAGETKDQVQLSRRPITRTPYVEIGAAPGGAVTVAPAPVVAEARGAVAPKARDAVAPKARDAVESELRELKRLFSELKAAQEEAGPAGGGAWSAGGVLPEPALRDAFEQLVLGGVERRYAWALVKKASFELSEGSRRDPEAVQDRLADEIMAETEVLEPLADLKPGSRGAAGPHVVALVGPTGVGKTTTLAKIASRAILRKGLKVGLVNFDAYRVGAFDQLATYAKILNVPFRSAATAEDLRAALSDFQSLDLVLVDTTGRSQKDVESLAEMEAALGACGGIHCHLVVSATTRDAEVYDVAGRFAVFRPQGVIFTKLDEASAHGSIFNLSQRSKLPLVYFTTGQRVPEDIEEATRERVAALVLDLPA